MGSLPRTLFLLGLASLAFDLASVLVKSPFVRSDLTAGDAIEAVGIYVVCWLYLRAGALVGAERGGRGRLLVLAAITFAFGHGIHVAANSIHDLLDRTGAGDPTGLATFWDEHAGHYLIDAARILFAILLSVGIPAGRVTPSNRRGALLTLAGGVFYGFISFADSVEGRTVPLVLPFFLGYAVWALTAAHAGTAPDSRPERAVRRFFAAASVTALLLYAIWGIWQGGFPEFTAVGLLPSAETRSQ